MPWSTVCRVATDAGTGLVQGERARRVGHEAGALPGAGRRAPGSRPRPRSRSTSSAAGCCCPTAARPCASRRARAPTSRRGSGCSPSTPRCSAPSSRTSTSCSPRACRTPGRTSCRRCGTALLADDRLLLLGADGRAHRGAADRAGRGAAGVRRAVRRARGVRHPALACSTTTCTTTTCSRRRAGWPAAGLRLGRRRGRAPVRHAAGQPAGGLRPAPGCGRGAPELLRLRDAYLSRGRTTATRPTCARRPGSRCGSVGCRGPTATGGRRWSGGEAPTRAPFGDGVPAGCSSSAAPMPLEDAD